MKYLIVCAVTIPALANAQTCSPPGPAAAAGYTNQTFGGDLRLGENIFPITGDNASSGVSQNADGSISIRGGDNNSHNDQLNTGSILFGGGAYIQADIRFDNPPAGWSSSVDGWPSFWMTSTESNNVEVDFFEFMDQGKPTFNSGMIDWGQGGPENGSFNGNPHVSVPGLDTSQFHTYGYLWVPATSSSQGYTKTFVDGQEVAQIGTWNQGDMFSSLDSIHQQIIFGTGSANPMTVANLQVWQGAGAGNSKAPQISPAAQCNPTRKTGLDPEWCLTAAPFTSGCPAPVKPPASIHASVPGLALPSLGGGFNTRPSQPSPPQPAARDQTTSRAVNPAALASSNCAGLTFQSNGTKGWNYGGTNDGLSSGNGEFASTQASGPSPAVASNGTGMSVGVVQSGDALHGTMLNTHKQFAQQYGYFEMTANLTKEALQPGMTTAFWLMPENGGWPPEIDIEETSGNTGDTDVHAVPGQSSGASHQYNMQPGKHVWAVDWNKDTITFYIDGQIPKLDSGSPAVVKTPDNFHTPMYMVLDAMSHGATGSMNVENIRVFKDMTSALACVPGVDSVQPTGTASNQQTRVYAEQSPVSPGVSQSQSEPDDSPDSETVERMTQTGGELMQVQDQIQRQEKSLAQSQSDLQATQRLLDKIIETQRRPQ